MLAVDEPVLVEGVQVSDVVLADEVLLPPASLPDSLESHLGVSLTINCEDGRPYQYHGVKFTFKYTMRSTERSISLQPRRKSNQLDSTWYSDSAILSVFLRFSTKQYLAE